MYRDDASVPGIGRAGTACSARDLARKKVVARRRRLPRVHSTL